VSRIIREKIQANNNRHDPGRDRKRQNHLSQLTPCNLTALGRASLPRLCVRRQQSHSTPRPEREFGQYLPAIRRLRWIRWIRRGCRGWYRKGSSPRMQFLWTLAPLAAEPVTGQRQERWGTTERSAEQKRRGPSGGKNNPDCAQCGKENGGPIKVPDPGPPTWVCIDCAQKPPYDLDLKDPESKKKDGWEGRVSSRRNRLEKYRRWGRLSS
jgi:hypothetical protein